MFLIELLLLNIVVAKTEIRQSVEMLQVKIFSFISLMGEVFSKECSDFTRKDMEGPFWVDNVPLKVGGGRVEHGAPYSEITVVLGQLSYVMKNQLKEPKAPY